MKTLHLVYGENSAEMQKVAGQLRAKHIGAEIQLRSANAFVGKPEIETAGSVHILGDYPVIKEAYDGLAEVTTHKGGKAEEVQGTYDPTFGEGKGDLKRQKLDAARRFDQARAEGRLAGTPDAEETVKEEVADEKASIEKMTVAQLKEHLTAKGIAFEDDAKKADLVELATKA